MKTKASLFFLLLILIGRTVVNAAEQPKEVPDQLWRKVQNKVWAKLWEEVRSKGTVRVLVLFDLNHESLQNVGKEEQIRLAQDLLLAELSGTTVRLNGRFKSVPGMGLSVGTEGLTILERSSLVKAVEEDAPEGVK